MEAQTDHKPPPPINYLVVSWWLSSAGYPVVAILGRVS